jgi:hypothetical protein
MIFDEMERLHDSRELFVLLAHYAELAAPNREAWQPRLMELGGVEPRVLALLHGELIAYGWLEQNTGQMGACYRITTAGVRAWKQAREEVPVG